MRFLLLFLFLFLLLKPGFLVADERRQLWQDVRCVADQTAGFHDHPGGGENYDPAMFFQSTFRLELNEVLMKHLDPAAKEDLHLTLLGETGPTELSCRYVRAAAEGTGYSCTNNPPSEMILINDRTLRFTRTAVGGWTFTGGAGADSGSSIFVEYGSCRPASEEQEAGLEGSGLEGSGLEGSGLEGSGLQELELDGSEAGTG